MKKTLDTFPLLSSFEQIWKSHIHLKSLLMYSCSMFRDTNVYLVAGAYIAIVYCHDDGKSFKELLLFLICKYFHKLCQCCQVK